MLTPLLLFQNCGIYSFGGVNIAPEVKTITIDYFQNLAPLVVPSLSNVFTNELKEQFNRQTRLAMVQADGDLHFTGEIKGYDVAPAAITGDEVASLNRLTIRVRVKYENKFDETQNFDKEFSAYDDFPGSKSIESVQLELNEKIVKILVENIFNASVVNW